MIQDSTVVEANRSSCAIYQTVPCPMTLSDPYPEFQVYGVNIDAVDILCVQLTQSVCDS